MCIRDRYHNIAVKPSEMQKEMVASLAERAEQVRGGGVDSSVDNMLKITNDGRKLALDPVSYTHLPIPLDHHIHFPFEIFKLSWVLVQ